MAHTTVLPLDWEVPQVFHDRLGDGPGRQRVMESAGHLLLITHRPPGANDNGRSGRYFWRDPAGAWRSSDLGAGKEALLKHLGQYTDAVRRLDKLEEHAQSSEEYFQVISELAPLLRATRNLHQALQQAREMVGNDRILINLRDRAYELEREAELLYNEAKNELDFLIAHRAEQQAASSHRMAVSAHRLNILAAFFFPMVTLATIFSTSLEHGIEKLYVPIPFFALIALGLLLGLILNRFVNVAPEPKRRRDHGAEPRIPRQP